MLMTPICPKVRARPSAASSRIEPRLNPGEELGDDYVHDRSRFLVCCAGRSVAQAGLLRSRAVARHEDQSARLRVVSQETRGGRPHR